MRLREKLSFVFSSTIRDDILDAGFLGGTIAKEKTRKNSVLQKFDNVEILVELAQKYKQG